MPIHACKTDTRNEEVKYSSVPRLQLDPPSCTHEEANPSVPISQLNPSTSQLNPPTSELNPPTSQLNPPTSQLNPPTLRINIPISELIPPTSELNPPRDIQLRESLSYSVLSQHPNFRLNNGIPNLPAGFKPNPDRKVIYKPESESESENESESESENESESESENESESESENNSESESEYESESESDISYSSSSDSYSDYSSSEDDDDHPKLKVFNYLDYFTPVAGGPPPPPPPTWLLKSYIIPTYPVQTDCRKAEDIPRGDWIGGGARAGEVCPKSEDISIACTSLDPISVHFVAEKKVPKKAASTNVNEIGNNVIRLKMVKQYFVKCITVVFSCLRI